MHDAQEFLQDFAVVLVAAAVVTVLFRYLRQPPVLGYLIAGLVVGPHVPIPLFADIASIGTLSELGVILVMFSLGLEFSLRRVAHLLPTAGVTGLIQLSGMFWLGYAAGQLLGWTGIESVFAGSMVAISSTMIVARTFSEQGVDDKQAGLVFGVLIVQDLAAVLLLAILSTVAVGESVAAGALADTAAGLIAFLVGSVVLGYMLVPRTIRLIARLDSSETLLVASVGLAFGSALLAHKLGFSVALGAFLAGSLVAESGHADEIDHMVAPLRDLFAAVFFVAVGMMVDPMVIVDNWPAVLTLTLLVLLVQPTLVSFGTFVAGNDIRSSIRTGMSLGQIGEFSFIIAGIGVASGAIRTTIYPVAVAVCVVTSFLTPWMIKWSQPLALAIERRLPRRLQTYVSLYGSWREAMRSREASRSTARRIRRLIALLFLDSLVLAAIFIGAVVVHQRYLVDVAEDFGVAPHIGLALLIGAGLVVAIPFAIGLARCARELGRTLAGLILPAVESGELDLAAAPRRALLVSFQLLIALLVGLPLLALTYPFLPGPTAAIVFAGIIALLGVAFWRSAHNLEEHVKAGAHLVVEVLMNQAAPASRRLHEVESLLPGIGSVATVRVEPGWAAVGRTLIDLNIRGLTGATVLTIARKSGAIIGPVGHEKLAEEDVLGMTGTTDAIMAATALLRDGQMPEPE